MDDFFDSLNAEDICLEINDIEEKSVAMKFIASYDICFSKSFGNNNISIDVIRKMLASRLNLTIFKDSPGLEINIDSVDSKLFATHCKYIFHFSLSEKFGSDDDLYIFLTYIINLFNRQEHIETIYFYIEECGKTYIEKCGKTCTSGKLVPNGKYINPYTFCNICKYLVYGEINEEYWYYFLDNPHFKKINALLTNHIKYISDDLCPEESLQSKRFKNPNISKYNDFIRETNFFNFGKIKRRRIPTNLKEIISSDNNKVKMSLCLFINDTKAYNFHKLTNKKLPDDIIINAFMYNSDYLMKPNNRMTPINYNKIDISNNYMLRVIYLGFVWSGCGIIVGSLGLYGQIPDVIDTMKRLYNIKKEY